jgi:hypothetical protein
VLEINNGTAGTLRDLKLRNITVYDTTATTGSTLAVIQAGAGQSGNLLSVRNNAGAEQMGVTASGALTAVVLTGISATISPEFRSYSTQNILLRGSNAASIDLVQFGGTTSSFPALKRSSAILQARLADDSANTQMQASRFIADQTTPAASSDACTAGALWADATYIYACTASGTIKRATLATF